MRLTALWVGCAVRPLAPRAPLMALRAVDDSVHFGDILGGALDTDVSLLASSDATFTPLQRVALTANGNLQRIISSYHDARVDVRVVRGVKLKAGLYERAVVIDVRGVSCCVAASVVACFTPDAQRMVDGGKTSIGQIFVALGELPRFHLLEVAQDAKSETFRRVYTLSSSSVMCHIEETMPSSLFDLDFVHSAHPQFEALVSNFLAEQQRATQTV
ncbi:hypothetical protein M885DRAFT_522367 [Pelagophyceae sp. CCMP2097]|nr:hypothetical protein M885DRAFT_522367 [Pelagophyceae sp. CCMP2097]